MSDYDIDDEVLEGFLKSSNVPPVLSEKTKIALAKRNFIPTIGKEFEIFWKNTPYDERRSKIFETIITPYKLRIGFDKRGDIVLTIYEKTNIANKPTTWVNKYEFKIQESPSLSKDKLVDGIIDSLWNYRKADIFKIDAIYEDVFEYSFQEKLKDDGFIPNHDYEIFAKFILDLWNWEINQLKAVYRYYNRGNYSKMPIYFEELEFIFYYLLSEKRFDTLKLIIEEKIIIDI